MNSSAYQKKIEDLPKLDATLLTLKKEMKDLTGKTREDKYKTYVLLDRNKKIDQREIVSIKNNKISAAGQAAL